MKRIPEPELMEEEGQVRAYSEADFTLSHDAFVGHAARVFSSEIQGQILDLGCGPADISVRFARRFAKTKLVGVDGSEAMLRYGRERIKSEGLAHRIRLVQCFLPSSTLSSQFDGAISNSLLHHLHDPDVLWSSLKSHVRPGAPVFIMDLLRPQSKEDARRMVEDEAVDEPGVLQRDFFLSLCAAFRMDEIEEQLEKAELTHLNVEIVSDRHLVVYGRL
jgi:cyclopropane fatty-acyl-phospholipid synthase-like methyltransferase